VKNRAREAWDALGWRAVGYLAVGVLLAGVYLRGEDIRSTVQRRIEVIEQVQPTDVVRECLRTPQCRRLLRAPRRPARAEGGGAIQPAPAGQRPGPRHGGDVGGQKPPRQIPHNPPERPQADSPQPPPRAPGGILPDKTLLPQSPAPSGPVEDPGGALGEIICSADELGLPLC